ncbi:hypothetical protein [Paenibacillus pabuli]|uniref:hypothetical protein n=1 Tax=Paenibacillus pabuli TaxID=1472 RepID=UPI001FFF67DF|nr:hypothetical protein [Paenibacillus pabuli]UPK42503.1 hypothetical protein KET34_25440 [Paenibacillus pabuli]
MPNLKLVGGKKKDNIIPYISPDSICGCNKPAVYEVYEGKSKQGHCLNCMLEAVDNKNSVMVRKIGGGGFDDAS